MTAAPKKHRAALSRRCPQCGAAAGQPCRGVAGQALVSPHDRRRTNPQRATWWRTRMLGH